MPHYERVIDKVVETSFRGLSHFLASFKSQAGVAQTPEPVFDDRNEIAPDLKERRKECKGKDPNEVIPLLRPRFRPLVEQWKETAAQDEAHWREWEKNYFFLCLSAIHDHILMWSHYWQDYTGAVFAIRPLIHFS